MRARRMCARPTAQVRARRSAVRSGSAPPLLLLLTIALLSACADREEITPPLPVGGPAAAEYPLDLWDRGVEGETVLRIRVLRTGDVDSVEVAESSGHAAFDSAAVRWGRSAVFAPSTRGADTVEVWARVPVRFQRERGATDETGPPDRPDEAAPSAPPGGPDSPNSSPPPTGPRR